MDAINYVMYADAKSFRSGDAWTTPPVGRFTEHQREVICSYPTAAAGANFQLGQTQEDLAGIQQEEEEFQAEIDFMSWWTGEEEHVRIKAETQAPFAEASAASPNGKPYGGRGGKRTSNVKRKPAADGSRPPKPSNNSRRPSGQAKAEASTASLL